MKPLHVLGGAAIAALVSFSSASGDFPGMAVAQAFAGAVPPAARVPPLADAGPDQAIDGAGVTVHLDGSASTDCLGSPSSSATNVGVTSPGSLSTAALPGGRDTKLHVNVSKRP